MEEHLFPNERSLSQYIELCSRNSQILDRESIAECVHSGDSPVFRLRLTGLDTFPDLRLVFDECRCIASLYVQFSCFDSPKKTGSAAELPAYAAEILEGCMKMSQTLIRLHIPRSNVNDRVIRSLKPGILSCFQLTHLDLSKNSLTCDGLKIICELLDERYCLTLLDLSHNTLDSSSGEILGNQLRTNQTLQHLNLSMNALYDAGIRLILEALQGNKSLKILNISCCNLTRSSVPNISKTIGTNRSLTSVKVSGNRIGKDISEGSLLELCEALKGNIVLEDFDARDSDFSDSQMAEMSVRMKPIFSPTSLVYKGSLPAPLLRFEAWKTQQHNASTSSRSKRSGSIHV